MLSKKCYKGIGLVLRELHDSEKIATSDLMILADRLSDYFKEDNYRFDRDKFHSWVFNHKKG